MALFLKLFMLFKTHLDIDLLEGDIVINTWEAKKIRTILPVQLFQNLKLFNSYYLNNMCEQNTSKYVCVLYNY